MTARVLSPAPTHVTLRKPDRSDGADLHALIASCPPLDLNSRYAYLLLCEHHADTCVVAELNGRLVGAVTAYFLPACPTCCSCGRLPLRPACKASAWLRACLIA
jgi:L-2,4-diaminobutyric acid acetyltransferase